MKLKSFGFAVVMLGYLCNSSAQNIEPGTIPWTPEVRSGLTRVAIQVAPQFQALALNPNSNYLHVPEGWTANIYYAGTALGKPRFIAWGPDSVLFVANMNKNNILALRDIDRDGAVDTAIVAATGFSYGHDVRFYRDTMFVCQESGVVKLWRSDPLGYVFDKRVVVVDKSSQPNQTGGNHRTRTLVLDTITFKMYVSVGSRGNADRETNRALIEEYNWDGSGRRNYATGVRNAVGMTLHPRTGKLWANNNGSDQQGNDVPPEWFDIVREGGFYGYPFSYHFKNWFNLGTSDYKDLLPITKADSILFDAMVPSAALVISHSAPMAVEFAAANNPTAFRNGAFMALRGSWNRTAISGNKVVFLEFDNDDDTIANVVRDFCVGFITDTNNASTRWARPVGVTTAADGSVFVTSDDLKQFILKLTPPLSTGVDETFLVPRLRCVPNPATNNSFLVWDSQFEARHLVITSIDGRIVHSENIEKGALRSQVPVLPTGVYIAKLSAVGTVQSCLMTVSN